MKTVTKIKQVGKKVRVKVKVCNTLETKRIKAQVKGIIHFVLGKD